MRVLYFSSWLKEFIKKWIFSKIAVGLAVIHISSVFFLLDKKTPVSNDAREKLDSIFDLISHPLYMPGIVLCALLFLGVLFARGGKKGPSRKFFAYSKYLSVSALLLDFVLGLIFVPLVLIVNAMLLTSTLTPAVQIDLIYTGSMYIFVSGVIYWFLMSDDHLQHAIIYKVSGAASSDLDDFIYLTAERLKQVFGWVPFVGEPVSLLESSDRFIAVAIPFRMKIEEFTLSDMLLLRTFSHAIEIEFNEAEFKWVRINSPALEKRLNELPE